MNQSSSFLWCFLPDGFQTKSVVGNDADEVIRQIGDRKQPSTFQFHTPLGRPVTGTQFQLTEDSAVAVNSSHTMHFRKGEVLVYERTGSDTAH